MGVINNSASPVTSITLSGNNIFGFDGDGICGYIAASYCNSSKDPSGYGPNGVTFTTVNNSNGTVNFSPGIPASGGTAFFSLEEPPSIGGIRIGTPEPGTIGTLAAGVLVLALLLRKRLASF